MTLGTGGASPVALSTYLNPSSPPSSRFPFFFFSPSCTLTGFKHHPCPQLQYPHSTPHNSNQQCMTQSNSSLSFPRHALTRTRPMTPTLPPIVPTALTTWGHALRLPMPILLTTSIRPSQAKKSTECHRHASTGGRGSRPGVNVSQIF